MNQIKRLVNDCFRLFGREVLSAEAYRRLAAQSEELHHAGAHLREYEFLRSLPPEVAARVFELLPHSRAQLRQDLFTLATLDFKEEGYFVEFGATNGVDLSNSWLLENKFGWTGILAEPAKQWHGDLFKNRQCLIDTRCVWRSSGEEIVFFEAETGELSTIEAFAHSDMHAARRESGRRYPVKTVSLLDLLVEHRAPPIIDLLSIDTEGSEYEILHALDFERFRFRVITVEHNFTAARERLQSLLMRHGYERRSPTVSYVDDWYVLKSA